jgi:hypothetical protein
VSEYERWEAYHRKLYQDAGKLGPIADKIVLELRIPECIREHSMSVLLRNLQEAYNLGLKNINLTGGNNERDKAG